MTDNTEVVLFERRGNIALLTFNRPKARNAISPEVSQAMAGFLDEIEADDALRAVVLTGAGEVFCAGADLKVVAQGRAMDIARGKGGFAGVATRDFAKPMIAAVNGPALAGGFEVVLSCDLVVAADTSRFGIPEAQRGLMAAAGGLIRLPKRVPLAIALELAMTGDPIDASRALQLGLVNDVVPGDSVMSSALALAARISVNGPLAVRNTLKMVREASDLTEADAWPRNYELAIEVFSSKDSIEGATAFAEKREPQWTGT